MLHSVVSLLMLFAMLLHALLGCCWHHAHAHAAECSAHQELAESPQERHACSCLHDAARRGSRAAANAVDEDDSCSSSVPPEHDGDQRQHQGCDEKTCTYLASGASKVPTLADGSTLFDRMPSVDALTPRLIAGLRGDRWWGDSFLAAGPCVRDLTQVWLL